MPTLKVDDGEFQRMAAELVERDVRIASTWALNDTAQDVLAGVQADIRARFDRPTRFAQNAFAVIERARPGDLQATVAERPSVTKRHFLKVQEAGGPRPMTGTEQLIALHAPVSMDIRSVIPAAGGQFEGARIDAHGNWSSGERNQVLSSIRAQRDPLTNSTAASKKRKSRRASYFVAQHGLAPGVYRRRGADDIPVRVLKFSTKVPSYTPRLGFYEGAEATFAAKLPDHLRRTLGRMLAKRSAAAGGGVQG